MKTEYVMELLQRGGVITVIVPALSRDKVKVSINVPGGEWCKLTLPMVTDFINQEVIRLVRTTEKGYVKSEYILNKNGTH